MPRLAPLDAEFFARDTRIVARELVGVTLETADAAGVIVETEAYRDDAASHHVTRPRAAAMMASTFARLYVYRIYGMHLCLNVTTERDGPGAVLIRALRPLRGVDALRARRPGRTDRELTSGPAKLVAALGLDISWNGRAFDHGLTWTPSPESGTEPVCVDVGPRVGISRAKDLPWRFLARDDPFVSRGGSRRRYAP